MYCNFMKILCLSGFFHCGQYCWLGIVFVNNTFATWIDGSPLTMDYWIQQMSSFTYKNQTFHSIFGGYWNNDPPTGMRNIICQKRIGN